MSTEYDRADHGRLTESEDYILDDLSVAQSAANPLELKLQGRFVYLDDDTTGRIYIRFNDKNSHRFPLQSGSKIDNVVFNRVFLDWEAQVSSVANIVYGQDSNFIPSNDINNINQVGKVNDIRGLWYDRNLSLLYFANVQATVGPAVYSLYESYVVPANRVLRFSGGNVMMRRVTVAGVVAGFIVFIQVLAPGGIPVFNKTVFFSGNVVNDQLVDNFDVDLFLPAGSELRFFYGNADTGGTVFFETSMNGNLFDL